MSDPGPDAQHHALVQARGALSVLYARYWLALERTKTADPTQRTAAFAEADRVLERAGALRRRADALQKEIAALSEREESGPHGHDSRSSRPRAA
jgi:uncharacterized membrane protein YccC